MTSSANSWVFRSIICGLAVGFIACLSTRPAEAALNSATAVVPVPNYKGSCPGRVLFQGRIVGDAGTALSYSFSYYDPSTKASSSLPTTSSTIPATNLGCELVRHRWRGAIRNQGLVRDCPGEVLCAHRAGHLTR